jgi:putative hemolysin
VQIGITFAGFFSAAYGGSTLTGPLTVALTGLGLPPGPADVAALVTVTGAISYLSLVLGELVPKRLALQRSEAVALFAAPVLDRIATLFHPMIWLLSRSTNGVVRLLGLDPRAGGELITEEELRDLVATHHQLTAEERRVLGDVFAATDRRLSDVMVPRTRVEFLRADTPLEAATDDALTRPYSRYPVVSATADDVIGFAHVRDLLTALHVPPGDEDTGRSGADSVPSVATGRRPQTVRDIVRPVTFLPGSKALLPALSQLRHTGGHLAVVVDEYGGTDGIVTLEDLLEELVGDIRSEFDRDGAAPVATVGVTVELDGLLHRADVRDQVDIALPDGPFETLAGFVQAALGRVPVRGDTLTALGHRFTVLEMDGRRAAWIAVAAGAPSSSEPAGNAAPQPGRDE